jgi:large subunit ribosomal protein L19
MSILKKIEEEQCVNKFNYRVGDTLNVHVKIIEGDKERIQVFQGVLLRIHRGGSRSTFTVRKIASGVGVERVFPMHSPIVDKIEVIAQGRVRQARPYYLRDLKGRKARLKSRTIGTTSASN